MAGCSAVMWCAGLPVVRVVMCVVFDKVRVIVLGGRIWTWSSSNCLSTAASINPNEEDDHEDNFQF